MRAARQKRRIDLIKDAVKAFSDVQHRYARYGARDTEPDAVFQSLLVRAALGKPVETVLDGKAWQLFTSSMNCNTAAKALNKAARKAVDLVQACPLGESAELKEYLKAYCWRIDWH